MTTSSWKFSSLGSGVVALACAILLSAAAYAGPKGGGHGGGGGGFLVVAVVAFTVEAVAFTLAVFMADISVARAHSPDRISLRM